MDARYLPPARQLLPSRSSRLSRQGGLWLYAVPPLVVGLCVTVPFMLAAPRIAAGLAEGEAAGWE